MKIAAIVPAKDEDPNIVLEVVEKLPKSITPIVVWFERPSFIEKTSLIYGIEQQEKCGVGCAYREGFKVAIEQGYTHCLMYDADGDMDATTIPKMLKRLERGYELVVASRWASGGGFQNYDKLKLVVNFFGNFIFRFAFLTRITDLTFGFKIISTELLSKLELQSQGHDIYAETTMLPIAVGATCAEVPTVWKGRRNGVASLSIKKAFWIYLKTGMRILKLAYWGK